MAEEQLIVLTAASGKQCSHIIPHLYNDPHTRLRLVVHSPTSKDTLSKAYPAAEIIQADLTQPIDCLSILTSATTLLHIGPSFHPRETAIGLNIIDAARRTPTLQHFIYSSVLHTQLRKLLNHDCKRYVEEALMESGLQYTILQPTTFLDNIPVAMLAQQKGEVITFPALWDPDVEFSMLALQDLGEVAAKIVRDGEVHYYAEYALTSTWPVSQGEIVRGVGRVLGREVRIERKDVPQEGADVLCKGLFGGKEPSVESRDAAERMVLYYDRRGLKANPGVCEWLLGRKPTQWRDWLRANVEGT